MLFNGGVFSAWQCLRKDTESEVSLRSRETSLTTTERKRAAWCRSPSPVSRSGSDSFRETRISRDAFSYAEAPFHSPTLSSVLSNTETIGSTSQETRRKLEEDAAIEKRSRSTEVNGAVHGPCTGKGALCGCVARK